MTLNLVLRSRKGQFREQISNIRSREVIRTLQVAALVAARIRTCDPCLP